MTTLPQSFVNARSPRIELQSTTPTVVRFSDGRHSRGELRIVSLTGGLLCLPRPIDRGSRVRVMFVTQTGAVAGAAEMLKPVSWDLQPFRFLSLGEGDQRKLRATIQSSLGQSAAADDWLDRHRARQIQLIPPRKRIPLKLLAALTLATIFVFSAFIYDVFVK
jgi:hypothetical protein